MISTDEFGQWVLVSPQLEVGADKFRKWNRLGGFHKVTSGTYRFSFSSPDFSLINSYAWIRSVHKMPDSNNELVSYARRIYPKPEKLRAEFWIPENLASVGVVEQCLEFKPIFKRYRTTTKIWSLSVEQLILTEKQTDNTVVLVLDNPRYAKDPLRTDLWVSTFTQEVTDKRGLILPSFEVGRFYRVEDNSVFSDPVILESTNGRLTVAFTAEEIIQSETIYARIIY